MTTNPATPQTMKIPLILLKFVGKAVGNAVGGGIAGDLLFDVVPDLAAEGYKWWKKDRKPQEMRDDLAAVANASPEEVKEAAKEIVEEVAADQPPANIDH